tara:strand:- start:1927 stop:2196 length:270 start_codon:yes stop_codon:yes gene_type:complete
MLTIRMATLMITVDLTFVSRRRVKTEAIHVTAKQERSNMPNFKNCSTCPTKAKCAKAGKCLNKKKSGYSMGGMTKKMGYSKGGMAKKKK